MVYSGNVMLKSKGNDMIQSYTDSSMDEYFSKLLEGNMEYFDNYIKRQDDMIADFGSAK